eukprot:TRINITY_DN2787_c0_g1_i1.p2 TRINITY_DN2787_c0_g1~~TRINITY_DN2787_c0_g1_i1.p2  ORF type:complete len:96 (+),score=13.41 TRINITY_DN2787_c0_g1_i1:396-683(+)
MLLNFLTLKMSFSSKIDFVKSIFDKHAQKFVHTLQLIIKNEKKYVKKFSWILDPKKILESKKPKIMSKAVRHTLNDEKRKNRKTFLFMLKDHTEV